MARKGTRAKASEGSRPARWCPFHRWGIVERRGKDVLEGMVPCSPLCGLAVPMNAGTCACAFWLAGVLAADAADKLRSLDAATLDVDSIMRVVEGVVHVLCEKKRGGRS